jgi:hypothetical protein
MARCTWYGMLWLMRRPWMRRLQRASMRVVLAPHREAVSRRRMQTDRFARRHGLRVLTFMFGVLLASVIFTASYFVVLTIFESISTAQSASPN